MTRTNTVGSSWFPRSHNRQSPVYGMGDRFTGDSELYAGSSRIHVGRSSLHLRRLSFFLLSLFFSFLPFLRAQPASQRTKRKVADANENEMGTLPRELAREPSSLSVSFELASVPRNRVPDSIFFPFRYRSKAALRSFLFDRNFFFAISANISFFTVLLAIGSRTSILFTIFFFFFF